MNKPVYIKQLKCLYVWLKNLKNIRIVKNNIYMDSFSNVYYVTKNENLFCCRKAKKLIGKYYITTKRVYYYGILTDEFTKLI